MSHNFIIQKVNVILGIKQYRVTIVSHIVKYRVNEQLADRWAIIEAPEHQKRGIAHRIFKTIGRIRII